MSLVIAKNLPDILKKDGLMGDMNSFVVCDLRIRFLWFDALFESWVKGRNYPNKAVTTTASVAYRWAGAVKEVK